MKRFSILHLLLHWCVKLVSPIYMPLLSYTLVYANFCLCFHFCCLSSFFASYVTLRSNSKNWCFRPCKIKCFHYGDMSFIYLACLTLALNTLNYRSRNSNSCFLCYAIGIAYSFLIFHIWHFPLFSYLSVLSAFLLVEFNFSPVICMSSPLML